jgi:hypothetical protein
MYAIQRASSEFVNRHAALPCAEVPETLTFEPTEETPDTLYYQCTNHRYMGGTIVVGSETATDAPSRQQANELPEQFRLEGNYPNPFNPTTKINYQLPRTSDVTLQVYDVLGRQVATLVDRKQQAGSYTVTFDGNQLSSGVYFYRLKTENASKVRKMLLVK